MNIPTLLRTLLVAATLILSASDTQAQWAPWQKIAPPIEQRDILADGSVAAFTFSLPVGMQYWVHTSNSIVAASNGDRADAHSYNGFPTTAFVGVKVRTNPATENFLQNISPRSYSASHDYIDQVASSGEALKFRFFDRNEPGTGVNYYNDNAGSISAEVAQWTPELIVQHDTLDFGTLATMSSKDLLDSIQAYGKQTLEVLDLTIRPITGGNIFTVNSERGEAFNLLETTNEIRVTASPVARGAFLAELVISTRNAYDGVDKIVILRGRALGPAIVMLSSTDTIDFGTVGVGSSSARGRNFLNTGDASTSITSVAISQPGIFTSVTPVALDPNIQGTLNFNFTPTAQGAYFAIADVTFAHGEVRRLYLRGSAGVGIPSLSTKFIDFGSILIGNDSTIGLRLTNVGNVEYLLESVTIDNNQFSFTGLAQNVKIGPSAVLPYTATFGPTFHLDPYHEGRMTFKFDNGTEEVVILRGRDISPLTALLKIDSNYYARPGEEISIYQRLIADLSVTSSPISKFTEFVQFDKDVLEFVRVEKADLVSSSSWILKTSQTGGAIDITVNSGTERLGGPGKLFKFVFRVRDEALPGTSTPITQVTPNFYNIIEPLASVQDGRVNILNRCDAIIIVGTEAATFIEQNRPNPFNPTTEILYSVAKEGRVLIELFNPIGERIATLVDEVQPSGMSMLRFDGSSLPSGVYTYVFSTGDARWTRRMNLVK